MILAVQQPVSYIYCITNMVNGKKYIGVSKNPKRRFNGHINQKQNDRLLLGKAVRKYGKENFELKILLQGTREYCYSLEAAAISLFGTLSPNGYNFSTGGIGGHGLFGEKNGAYGRVGNLHPMYGKRPINADNPVAEETRAKMRAAHLGKKRPSEFSDVMRNAQKNMSPEEKEKKIEKCRIAALNRSPELKEKMKLARIAAIQRKKAEA